MLAWTVFFLAIYVLAGEGVVRIRMVDAALGVPDVGSEHGQFEEQWFRLAKYVEGHGAVECIFIGDSTVMTDFSPTAFSRSYREQTGDELSCYNFGVGAISVVGAATLAALFVTEYTPRLLIVGLEPLNFTVPRGEQGAADLASVPWVRYHLGEFTLEGWAYEHIKLLGHLEAASRVLMLALHDSRLSLPGTEQEEVFLGGYYPMEGPGPFDVSQPPDPTMNHPYLEHYFAAHSTFELLPENIEALHQILAMNSPTTEVILVEMPLARTFHAFFRHGEEDYREFVTGVIRYTAEHDVPFLRMIDSSVIPDSAWFNYNHLTIDGAPIFSGWLAQKVALSSQLSRH
jgi:hypothetical protein